MGRGETRSSHKKNATGREGEEVQLACLLAFLLASWLIGIIIAIFLFALLRMFHYYNVEMDKRRIKNKKALWITVVTQTFMLVSNMLH